MVCKQTGYQYINKAIKVEQILALLLIIHISRPIDKKYNFCTGWFKGAAPTVLYKEIEGINK